LKIGRSRGRDLRVLVHWDGESDGSLQRHSATSLRVAPSETPPTIPLPVTGVASAVAVASSTGAGTSSSINSGTNSGNTSASSPRSLHRSDIDDTPTPSSVRSSMSSSTTPTAMIRKQSHEDMLKTMAREGWVVGARVRKLRAAPGFPTGKISKLVARADGLAAYVWWEDDNVVQKGGLGALYKISDICLDQGVDPALSRQATGWNGGIAEEGKMTAAQLRAAGFIERARVHGVGHPCTGWIGTITRVSIGSGDVARVFVWWDNSVKPRKADSLGASYSPHLLRVASSATISPPATPSATSAPSSPARTPAKVASPSLSTRSLSTNSAPAAAAGTGDSHGGPSVVVSPTGASSSLVANASSTTTGPPSNRLSSHGTSTNVSSPPQGPLLSPSLSSNVSGGAATATAPTDVSSSNVNKDDNTSGSGHNNDDWPGVKPNADYHPTPTISAPPTAPARPVPNTIATPTPSVLASPLPTSPASPNETDIPLANLTTSSPNANGSWPQSYSLSSVRYFLHLCI
jgi:hypothetical protein